MRYSFERLIIGLWILAFAFASDGATNLFPINRGLLQSDLNGGNFNVTNVNTNFAAHFVGDGAGLTGIAGGGGSGATNYWLEPSQFSIGPGTNVTIKTGVTFTNPVITGTFTATGLIDSNQLTTATAAQLAGSLQKLQNLADAADKRAVAANVGIIQMSPVGGNDAYADMGATGTNFVGQMGVSRFGNQNFYVWISATNNGGSNAWRAGQLSFPGGMQSVGNDQFKDSPAQVRNAGGVDGSVTFYTQYGSNASTHAAAYVGGLTNVPGDIVQPAFVFVGGNPWSASGLVSQRGVFTNAAHGFLIGTNAEGLKLYQAQFGITWGQISDAYTVGELNQAPSDQFPIYSNTEMDHYASVNGQRSGDSNLGQIPLEVTYTSNLNNIKKIFPLQVANVWALTNALFKYSLYINESTGNVEATNGTTTLGDVVVGGVIKIAGRKPGADESAGANINTNVIIGLTGAGASMLSVDYGPGGSHRLGIGLKTGQYPKHIHAAGAPWTVARSDNGDLQSNMTSQTLTDELTIDASGNATFTGTVTSGAHGVNTNSLNGAAASILGSVRITSNGVATAVNNALSLTNETAAAVGAPQNSPAFSLAGNAWNTVSSLSRGLEFRQYVKPSSAAAYNGSWQMDVFTNGVSLLAAVLGVDQAGNFTTGGNITAGGNITVGSGNNSITMANPGLGNGFNYVNGAGSLRLQVGPTAWRFTDSAFNATNIWVGIVIATNGVASYATNIYSVTVGGYTNLGTKSVKVIGFTGTSVTQLNIRSGTTFNLGTITAPADKLLNPQESLTGSSCAAAGIQDF